MKNQISDTRTNSVVLENAPMNLKYRDSNTAKALGVKRSANISKLVLVEGSDRLGFDFSSQHNRFLTFRRNILLLFSGV